MTTHTIIRPFWERRWLILTITLTVTVGTFCWSLTLPNAYKSSLVLAATSSDGRPIPRGQVPRLYQTLKTAPAFFQVIDADPFKELRTAGVTNEALVERVSRDTGLREDHRGTSVTVQLSFLEFSPEAAEKGANVLGQSIASADLAKESETGFAFRVVQPASAATGPYKPQRLKLSILALGGGLLLGFALAGASGLIKYLRQVKFASPSVRAT